MPLTGTETQLAATMFMQVKTEVGSFPNLEAENQMKKLCNGLAKAIIPHIVSFGQVAIGIPTLGSPTAQVTVAPGKLV